MITLAIKLSMIHDFPGATLLVSAAIIAALCEAWLVGYSLKDLQKVRANNGRAAFMARHNLRTASVQFIAVLLLTLLSIRLLATAEAMLQAVPPQNRAAALRHIRTLTREQLEAALLFDAALVLLLVNSFLGILSRKQYTRRFNDERDDAA